MAEGDEEVLGNLKMADLSEEITQMLTKEATLALLSDGEKSMDPDVLGPPPLTTTSPLKVGFMSSDWRVHPVSTLVRSLIEMAVEN